VKRPERILVVDADIARAAGPDPKVKPWPESAKDAHDVLRAIREHTAYHIVFNSKLLKEWKKHQGHTARRWFATLLSAGRIQVARPPSKWIDDLIRAELSAQDQPLALKDSHLIALAHDAGDDRLLSNDGKAREKFRRLSDSRIKPIHWVAASSASAKWLRDGAPDKPQWQLGETGDPTCAPAKRS